MMILGRILRAVIKTILAGSIAALLMPLSAMAQAHSAFPVSVEMFLRGPTPVVADGQTRLLYELRLVNVSGRRIDLTGLEVFGGNGARPLASFNEDELEKMTAPVGPPDPAGKSRSMGPGRSLTVFLDLTLPDRSALPSELHHRLSFSYLAKDGTLTKAALTGPVVIVGGTAPVIRPPLRGTGWVAVNGLANPDHRRAINVVDGREHLAQRFAIDWVQLGPDGRFLHGDPTSNASYYDYGAEVLAVADGKVVGLVDGFAENAGDNPASARNVTLDNITGNSLVLDLGGGRFALYAHLQPRSMRVKLGDRVKAGQVLALLGNTGNSDAPHLHFQLMDANSPLGAEGIPYELSSFTEQGVVSDPGVWEEGKTWRPVHVPTPVVHRREFPVDNAFVSFP